jgi:hypothetical protein
MISRVAEFSQKIPPQKLKMNILPQISCFQRKTVTFFGKQFLLEKISPHFQKNL